MQKKNAAINNQAAQLWLTINTNKTEVIRKLDNKIPITWEGINLREELKFTHLSSTRTMAGECITHIKNRICEADGAMMKLNTKWQTLIICHRTKLKLFHSNLLSVLQYDTESRTMNEMTLKEAHLILSEVP